MGEMRIKVAIALTIALALGHRSHGSVIPLEGEAFHGQKSSLEDAIHGQQSSLEDALHAQQYPQEVAIHGEQVSVASSYVQFHGPVEGPEFEVKVPQNYDDGNHLHGQDHEYTVDYVAHPKYEFSYGVEDHHTGDFHNQKETRDGSSVSGEYSVKEPGGGIRVVRYRADKDGFHAVVHTSGKNDHSTGVYGGQGQAQVHDHLAPTQQGQDAGDYQTSYAELEGY